MAFFKKMVDKFEDVMGNDDKKKEQGHAETREGYGQNQYPHGGQPVQAPPPSVSTHPPGSPLPPGWVSHWDEKSQRYYYLEQATGRTQWDPPQQFGNLNGTGPPPAGPPMGAYGYDAHGQQGAPGGYYNQQYRQNTDSSGVGRQEVYQKNEKSGKGGMMAGAAGGLAVGAVGGALVNNAMDSDSDDETKAYAAQQQPTYAQEPHYYQEAAPPPPVAPGSDHSSVSSSDKEDLEEAREDYENASASDKESARDDYEEQYNETYGSD